MVSHDPMIILQLFAVQGSIIKTLHMCTFISFPYSTILRVRTKLKSDLKRSEVEAGRLNKILHTWRALRFIELIKKITSSLESLTFVKETWYALFISAIFKRLLCYVCIGKRTKWPNPSVLPVLWQLGTSTYTVTFLHCLLQQNLGKQTEGCMDSWLCSFEYNWISVSVTYSQGQPHSF